MNKKITISMLFCCSVFLSSCDLIKTKDEYYSVNSNESDKYITMSIDCSQILENMEKLEDGLEKYIPENGIILEETKYPISANETVYDVLTRAVKENEIQLEVQGINDNSFGSVYVEGINYIYEFSCGPESGWIYKVNDEFAQYGCNSFILNDGDKVQWIYTCSLEDY